jgi:hypothetical protein
MVGVVALYRSLRRVNALSDQRPLLVMITPEVTDSAKKQLRLAAAACSQGSSNSDQVPAAGDAGEDGMCGCIKIVAVDALGNPAAALGERAKKRFDSVYTKLNVFDLGRFAETIVFLDADMIVLRDTPELFDCLEPKLQQQLGSGGERGGSFAASAYEPYSSTHNADFFDSACMVLRPHEQTFRDMVRASRWLPSFDGGDAGFFNAFILGIDRGCEPAKREAAHAAAAELAAEHAGTQEGTTTRKELLREGEVALHLSQGKGSGTIAGNIRTDESLNLKWSVRLGRSYNFTSHWVREASAASFAKKWQQSTAPASVSASATTCGANSGEGESLLTSLDLDLGAEVVGGDASHQRPLSVLHYPGQAKPWKYVHLFSSEGLLSITQRYKSAGREGVAVERRVLIYNIDTADPTTAREAALRLCAPYDTINYARTGIGDSQSTPPSLEGADFGAVEVFVPSALPLVPAHMLAIVTFSDVAGAERAAAALNGTTFAQRSLSVGPVMIEYAQTIHVLCPELCCPSSQVLTWTDLLFNS